MEAVTVNADWYRTFFDDTYLRVFEPELTPTRTEDEVDGVEELAGLRPGSAVLDVACGHGRHAIALARRGHRVTGVDLSAGLLERARRDAARAGVEVDWRLQDMREPVGRGIFDAAVNLFNSFGYLERGDEDLRALRAIAGALAPDGVFLQEYGNREALIRDFRNAEVHDLDDDLLLVEERDLDLRRSRLTVRYRLLECTSGRSEERVHVLRLYTLTELVALHEAAGLHVEAVFGGLDGGALDLDDPYVVLRSRKAD